jgi:hypothetical protein
MGQNTALILSGKGVLTVADTCGETMNNLIQTSISCQHGTSSTIELSNIDNPKMKMVREIIEFQGEEPSDGNASFQLFLLAYPAVRPEGWASFFDAFQKTCKLSKVTTRIYLVLIKDDFWVSEHVPRIPIKLPALSFATEKMFRSLQKSKICYKNESGTSVKFSIPVEYVITWPITGLCNTKNKSGINVGFGIKDLMLRNWSVDQGGVAYNFRRVWNLDNIWHRADDTAIPQHWMTYRAKMCEQYPEISYFFDKKIMQYFAQTEFDVMDASFIQHTQQNLVTDEKFSVIDSNDFVSAGDQGEDICGLLRENDIAIKGDANMLVGD